MYFQSHMWRIETERLLWIHRLDNYGKRWFMHTLYKNFKHKIMYRWHDG